jgi:hypothetical protein
VKLIVTPPLMNVPLKPNFASRSCSGSSFPCQRTSKLTFDGLQVLRRPRDCVEEGAVVVARIPGRMETGASGRGVVADHRRAMKPNVRCFNCPARSTYEPCMKRMSQSKLV